MGSHQVEVDLAEVCAELKALKAHCLPGPRVPQWLLEDGL
jgi:hypothetical protein